MIEVRQSWRRLCLLSPFYDGLVGGVFFGGVFVTVVLVLAGIWAVVPIAATTIVVFEIRSAGLRMCAGGNGIQIRNRFVTHDIVWPDVRAISLSEKQRFMTVDDIRPILRVDRRSEPGGGIAVYAAIGMNRSELEELAQRLVELGRQNGFEFPWTTSRPGRRSDRAVARESPTGGVTGGPGCAGRAGSSRPPSRGR